MYMPSFTMQSSKGEHYDWLKLTATIAFCFEPNAHTILLKAQYNLQTKLNGPI